MSTIAARDGTNVPDGNESQGAPASSNSLFVVPHGRGDGFQAEIRGHLLELADPGSGHALAPTPFTRSRWTLAESNTTRSLPGACSCLA